MLKNMIKVVSIFFLLRFFVATNENFVQNASVSKAFVFVPKEIIGDFQYIPVSVLVPATNISQVFYKNIMNCNVPSNFLSITGLYTFSTEKHRQLFNNNLNIKLNNYINIIYPL